MKDLLRTADLTPDDFRLLLDLAATFKAEPFRARTMLRNETVVLYFNKPSTRTRISFETAVARLGGVPVMVGPHDLQLGRGETIEDTAQVMGRYARAFGVRTFGDEEVERFARAATIPVINMLTDGHHPCQSIADLFTVREKCGDPTRCKVAFVGDGNNVLHSLMEAAALTGMPLSVATPDAYGPDPRIVAGALEIAASVGGEIRFEEDPRTAVADANAVYTDTWISMDTPEAERAARLEAFAPYQVNAELMARAHPGAIFMHCMPDHRGEEVTAEIVDGPRSVVFDLAENRLHTEVAILSALIEGRLQGARGGA